MMLMRYNMYYVAFLLFRDSHYVIYFKHILCVYVPQGIFFFNVCPIIAYFNVLFINNSLSRSYFG